MQLPWGTGPIISAERLTLYLPDKDRYGKPVADIERWLEEACLLFTTTFGGATHLLAEGRYYNTDQHVFITETTHIIYSFTNPGTLFADLPRVRDFIHRFRIETDQHSVAVEFAGQVQFVSGQAHLENA